MVTAIEKDLGRTFPDSIHFGKANLLTMLTVRHGFKLVALSHLLGSQEHLEAMRRVLIAYSLRCPVIGYCQGMNFVAGLLLLIFGSEREKEVFTVFTVIIEKLAVDYFTVDLAGTFPIHIMSMLCFELAGCPQSCPPVCF